MRAFARGRLVIPAALLSFWILFSALCAAQPVEIKFLGRGNFVLQDMFTRIISQFEARHPNIKVTLIPNQGDYVDKLTSMTIGGHAPDVVFAAMGSVRDVVEDGFLQPLDAFVKADNEVDLQDYFPAAIQSGRYKGHLWMWPYDGGSYALMYNKELFDKSGLSYPNAGWSWTREVVDAARKLTNRQDGKITQFGMTDMAYYWWYLTWVMGGDIISNDGRTSTLSTPEVHRAVNWLLTMKNQFGIMPSVLHPADASGAFTAGQVGMDFNGRWAVINYRQSEFPWDVSVLPLAPDGRRVNLAFYSGFSMVKGSKHPKEAWAFIKFVGGSVGQSLLTQYGQAVPALISLAKSPVFLGSKPPENNVAFLEGMMDARSWPTLYIPNFGGEYSQVVYPEVQKIMDGKASVAQVLVPDFDKRVTAILQRGLHEEGATES